jgi:hypothetical protein
MICSAAYCVAVTGCSVCVLTQPSTPSIVCSDVEARSQDYLSKGYRGFPQLLRMVY